MRFDRQLYRRAVELAGPDHDVNDQIAIYRLSNELLDSGVGTELEREEWSKWAAESERYVRHFVGTGRFEEPFSAAHGERSQSAETDARRMRWIEANTLPGVEPNFDELSRSAVGKGIIPESDAADFAILLRCAFQRHQIRHVETT